MDIYRNKADDAWLIGATHEVTQRRFSDKKYGSRQKAYDAAKAELGIKPTRARRLETKTRANKKSMKESVGITHYTVRDGGQIKHRFAVCDPATNRPVMIHIGNENTYLKNWDRKYDEAQELRERLVASHKESRE